MSITSQATDRLNNGARWESTHEEAEGRHRVRALNIEQAIKAKPLDVAGLQHTLHVLAKNGLDSEGNRKPTARDRSAQRKAFQAYRKSSRVRRTAEPVVVGVEGRYVRLSHGQLRRGSPGAVYTPGKPFPCGSST
jgi:hypothetical protein